ncbi:MAG: MerR family transcriptional regulator [Lachnospiraceae bacterium]
MKIKEVENLLGITKANIRYYEKEGLLDPDRNEENNYREYSPEDIKCLERIKTLRLLGISILEIRQLNNGQLLFKDVMEKRLKKLQEEEQSLLEVRQICETILQNDIPFSEVNESLIDVNSGNWKTCLEKIMHEDITKEKLTKKQFNQNILIMLLWGYLINIAITGLFGSYLMHISETGCIGLIFAAAVIGSICYMGVYFTADIKLHILFFHISALILAPLTASVYRLFQMLLEPSEVNIKTPDRLHLSMLFIMLLIYAALFCYLVNKQDSRLKEGHAIFFSFAYTCLLTLIFGLLWDRWLFSFTASLAFTLYMGTCWRDAVLRAESCSRYYAINTSCRMINICGAFWNMHGKTTRAGWVRR